MFGKFILFSLLIVVILACHSDPAMTGAIAAQSGIPNERVTESGWEAMVKRPEDQMPEPPGGRAAERLREFLRQRYQDGVPPEGPPDSPPETPTNVPEEQGDGKGPKGKD
jgi:hypothetical protein